MRPALAPLLLALLAGPGCECGVGTWSPDDDEPCAVTLCLAGAGGDLSYGNHLLDDFCPTLPGLVERCDGDTCDPLWGTVDGAMAALVEVTGRVDPQCVISLVGHSWGGVNLGELANRVATSPDIAIARVDRAVLIDAFAPTAGNHVDLPDIVQQAWSYRHSAPVTDDCSSGVPLGPFTGLPIRCGPDTVCRDFDLSLEETDGYLGHCEIINLVHDAVLENVVLGTDERSVFPEVDVAARE